MIVQISTEYQARELGRQVRRARTELGLRQDELALAAAVSTRAIHQIEHGKTTSRFDVLTRVLDALGMELRATKRPRVRHAEERR